MSYSQNNEEKIIGTYFGSFKGHLLSLGENDGITLSNSRALIEDGWTADLVEPSQTAFLRLANLYDCQLNQVRLHQDAIGSEPGKAQFQESGTLLRKGDTSLVSTLVPSEMDRWGVSVEFSGMEVNVITVEQLLKQTMRDKFDFISIDCEGLDLAILRQMDLSSMGTKCICVEFNGKDEHLYFAHVRQYGFRLLHKNGENLIYVK